MANPTIEHPTWGAIEVLQDGGTWILCQVGSESKKISKSWLRKKGIAVDAIFKEPESSPVSLEVDSKEEDEELLDEDMEPSEDEDDPEWSSSEMSSEDEDDMD